MGNIPPAVRQDMEFVQQSPWLQSMRSQGRRQLADKKSGSDDSRDSVMNQLTDGESQTADRFARRAVLRHAFQFNPVLARLHQVGRQGQGDHFLITGL